MVPVHKVDFDEATWHCVLKAVQGVPFARRYMEQSNLRFIREGIKELPVEIRTWLAKSSGNVGGWLPYDNEGFVLSEFVGREGEVERRGCLGAHKGGVELFFESLLPEFTLLNISGTWSSGGVLGACNRKEATVYIQDRYLFGDALRFRRAQLESMLSCIRLRLVKSNVDVLRVILCCSEQGLKYHSQNDNLKPSDDDWISFAMSSTLSSKGGFVV